MFLDTARVAPEEQLHHLPADRPFFCGAWKVDMSNIKYQEGR